MKSTLTDINIEITSECNLDCLYCYNFWKSPGNNYIPPKSSYPNAKKLLRRLFRQTGVKHVTFTGGEPLLADRFAELVLYARLKKKTVTVISNGNFQGNDIYETLVKLGVGLFEIPVHSADPLLHDAMTGKKGSWEKSVNILKKLKELGADVVPAVIISKINFKEIYKTLGYLDQLGMKRIMLNRFNLGGTGIKNKEKLFPGKGELLEAFRQAHEFVRTHDSNISSNVCIPLCYFDLNQFSPIRFVQCSQDVTRMPVTIDMAGNIRLCNHSPVIAGNIFSQKLPDILDGDYANRWKNTIPVYCSTCEDWPHCLGGCRAASEQSGMGLTSPDPVLVA